MQADKNLMSGSTTMLVLSLLEEREMYGYQIITELAKRSDDTFVLQEGTLYPILHKLERNNYVESYLAETETERRRKYYRITRRGMMRLEELREQWRNFSTHVNDLVLGRTVLSLG